MSHFVEVETTPLSTAVAVAYGFIEQLQTYFDYDGTICGHVPLERRRLKAELQEDARASVKRANVAVGAVFRVNDTARRVTDELYQNRGEIVASLRKANSAVRAFLTFTGEIVDAEEDLEVSSRHTDEIERICATLTPTVLLVQQHIQKLKQVSSGKLRQSFSTSGDAQFIYEEAQTIYEAMKERRDGCFVYGVEAVFAYVDQARLLYTVEPYRKLVTYADGPTSEEEQRRISKLAELSTLLDQIEASALVEGAVGD